MIDAHAIRFGGQEISDGFLFELSGGALPLDFANTLDERPSGGCERLHDYRALVRWAEQAGILSEQQSSNLAAAAVGRPGETERIHIEALALRELIFATIEATIRPPALTEDQLRQWNAWLERVRASRGLRFAPQGLEWQDAASDERLDGVSLALAKASIELFLDPLDRSRIRLCAADDCDWAFLDRSRRMNRVWCDMTVCGNRAKQTRHYRRRTGR